MKRKEISRRILKLLQKEEEEEREEKKEEEPCGETCRK